MFSILNVTFFFSYPIVCEGADVNDEFVFEKYINEDNLIVDRDLAGKYIIIMQ